MIERTASATPGSRDALLLGTILTASPGLIQIIAAAVPDPRVGPALAAIPTLVGIGLIRSLLRRREAIQAERSAHESALTQARQEATEADRRCQEAIETSEEARADAAAKSNFLATMSHEIRTPMNGIIGNSELLMELSRDEEEQALVQTIQSCGMSLLRVIDDILDFTKSEAGQMILEEQDFDPSALIEELSELMAPRAHAKGVELVGSSDITLPGVVCGDPGRLRQVLTNLLSNAAKFTRSGEIVLESLIERQDEGTVWVQFSVSDTGIGIPSDKLDQVFKSYIQAESSTPRRFGGTGLGLAISRQFVELMGGTLQVESTQGEGSRFFFTIPLQIRDATPSSTNLPLRGRSVLYAAHCEAERQRAGRLLEELGCEHIGLAEDAMSALQHALVARQSRRPYDVILIDRNLPGLNGLQLARMLRAQPETSEVPLILTTLKTEVPASETLEEIGICDVITRPLRPSRLCRSILRAHSSGACADDAPDLPEMPPLSDLAEPPRPSVPAPPSGGPQPRVLLADDNEFNQTLICRQLVRLGYEVDVVPHGRAAVEQFFRKDYAAVLMDCQMPEMSGYDATREIRRREAGRDRTPIIALTADVLPGIRERCREAGMDAYLSKPVWLKVLSETLAQWVPARDKAA